MRDIDRQYMARCLQLAKCGKANVNPNPMVGSVIVENGEIIGEGYHREFGGPHAEVYAIASVKEESRLRNATLYVNLEPCSHYGKTPPCTELIIEKGIRRVVVGCLDPFPEVSGKGVALLREAGVEVDVGCLKEEAERLNRVFIVCHRRKRPYILLKWAQSRDGFIDRIRENKTLLPEVFSTPVTSQEVHKVRAEHTGVMVGTRTALLDDPSLSVRWWPGPDPVRIVLDRTGVIPAEYRLRNGKQRTLIVTSSPQTYEPSENIEIITVDFTQSILEQILDRLYTMNITSLLVEGGAVLLNSFIREGLWDEMRVEVSGRFLLRGISAPDLCNLPFPVSIAHVDGQDIMTYRKDDPLL